MLRSAGSGGFRTRNLGEGDSRLALTVVDDVLGLHDVIGNAR